MIKKEEEAKKEATMTEYLMSVRAKRMSELYRTETLVRTEEGVERARELVAEVYQVEVSEVLVLS